MTKNYLSLALMATALLTACSSDEILDDENTNTSNQAITFGSYLTTTRATTVMDTTLLHQTGFGVHGYTHTTDWTTVPAQTAPDFMRDQEVTYNSKTYTWSYSPLKYWPADNTTRLSFVAWAPFDKLHPTASGAPTVDYGYEGTNAQIDTSKMFDLVAAHNLNLTSAKNYRSAVSLQFKHALSRVNIRVATNDVYYDATSFPSAKRTIFLIEQVTIKGDSLFTSGTFDLATDTWTSRSTASNAATAWSIFPLMDTTKVHPYLAYTTSLTAQQNQASLAAKDQSTLSDADKAILATDYTVDTLHLAAKELGYSTDFESLFRSPKGQEEYLFLIPSHAASRAGEGHITVTFTYKVVTFDSKLASKYYVEKETTQSVTILQPIHQGNAYNWNFTFSRNGVTFDSTTDSWTEGETGDSNDNNTPEYDGSDTGNISDVINLDYYLLNDAPYSWWGQDTYKFTNKGNGKFYYVLTDALKDFMIGTQNSNYRLYGVDSHVETKLHRSNSEEVALTLRSESNVCHYIYVSTEDAPVKGDTLWFDPVNRQTWITIPTVQ